MSNTDYGSRDRPRRGGPSTAQRLNLPLAFRSAVSVSFCPVTLCRKISHRISCSLLVSRYASTNDAASADDSIASVINHAQICLRFIFILLFYSLSVEFHRFPSAIIVPCPRQSENEAKPELLCDPQEFVLTMSGVAQFLWYCCPIVRTVQTAQSTALSPVG